MDSVKLDFIDRFTYGPYIGSQTGFSGDGNRSGGVHTARQTRYKSVAHT